MAMLFRLEAWESRRRKIYGGVRLWQPARYTVYFLCTIATLPVLLAAAAATPYTEVITVRQFMHTEGEGVTPTDFVARAELRDSARLAADTPVTLRIRGPHMTGAHEVPATVLRLSDDATADNRTVRLSLSPLPGKDQEVLDALRHGRALEGAIVLPRTNLLQLVAGFGLNTVAR